MEEIEKLKEALRESELQNDVFRKKLFEVQKFCEDKEGMCGDVWGMIEILWHEP